MDFGTILTLIGTLASLWALVSRGKTSRRLTREQRWREEAMEHYWKLGIYQWQAACNNSPGVLAGWRLELTRWTQAIQRYKSGIEAEPGSDLPVIFDDSGLAEAELECRRLQMKIQTLTLDVAKAKREGYYCDYSSFTLDPTKEDLGVPYCELSFFLQRWLDLKAERDYFEKGSPLKISG